MSETASKPELLKLTAAIVSAHVAKNPVPAGDLPGLIVGVHSALASASQPATVPAAAPEPAVPIKKSITAGYLVCLEDGKKMKMLKRHLWTAFNLTPEQYRQKWGLPSDYPMVAPAYAERRSALAKKAGLGTKRPGTTKKRK